jgi:DNA-binding HxlR family transcriptional regulator
MEKETHTCAIARTLSLFGDKWSLLILRDIILHKKSRFKDFRNSKEQIASNILTNRLKALLKEGFIEVLNPLGTKKSTQYIATSKGLETLPLLIEMYLFSIHSIDESALDECQIGIKNAILKNRKLFQKKKTKEYLNFILELRKGLLPIRKTNAFLYRSDSQKVKKYLSPETATIP